MGLFDFLKNKKEIDKDVKEELFKANDIIDRLLECSTAYSSKPGYFPTSLYVVGYLYGATDAMYQKLFPDVDEIHFMATYNTKLLTYYKEKQAISLSKNLEELTKGSNAEFSKGMKDGGNEIFAWLKDKKHPASLELYLNENSKNLNYDASKKFLNDDYKKVEKIIKSAYEKYKKRTK
tara:strand:- start:851 stop:1384 length:534 start_codon:yes stop_codon:yes gene_type:complete